MENDEPHEQTLFVTNGATLTVDTLCCGWFSDNPSQRIDVLVDASTVNGTYSIWPMHNLTSTAKAYYTVRNGSMMYSRTPMLISGVVDMDFTDSVFAKDSTLGFTGVTVDNKWYANGLLKFGGGSTAYIDNLNANGANGRLTLAFDGGTWMTGSGDTALKVYYISVEDPSKITVRLDAGGATIPVESGCTLTVAHPLTGEGAFTKTGAGTMAFTTQSTWNKNRLEETKWTADPVTWAFAGEAQIEEGVVSVEEGASTAASAAYLAADATLVLSGEVAFGRLRGAGAVSGGTLSGATLVAALDETGANTNEVVTLDCALSGVTKVDFGAVPGTPAPRPLPRNVVVANYTGAELGAWKGVNLGDSALTTAFRLEDGKVLCDFRRDGMVIFVK